MKTTLVTIKRTTRTGIVKTERASVETESFSQAALNKAIRVTVEELSGRALVLDATELSNGWVAVQLFDIETNEFFDAFDYKHTPV